MTQRFYFLGNLYQQLLFFQRESLRYYDTRYCNQLPDGGFESKSDAQVRKHP
jgi:hypothetical protein